MLLQDYKTIIFDFDGVLFDTNDVKASAINNAVKPFTSDVLRTEFVEYFTANNGLPREIKIEKFFSPSASEQILKRYNQLLATELLQAQPIEGCQEFLEILTKFQNQLIILSGGDKGEIYNLLHQSGLAHYFSEILTGPYEKHENIASVKYQKPALFFGDSRIDIELAIVLNLDFVFMGNYDCAQNRKLLRKTKKFDVIRNYKELIHVNKSRN